MRGRTTTWLLLFMSVAALMNCSGGGSSSPTPASPSPSGTSATSFPSITSFSTTPSNNFVLDATGLSQVGGVKPYMGNLSACSDGAAILVYPNQTNSFVTDIYSPVNGVVDRADTCVDGGSYDRYGFNIEFANLNGNKVDLAMTLEPGGPGQINPHPCSGGVSGQDNGLYKPYMFVSAGQTVTAGQRIAQLYHPPLSAFQPGQANNPDGSSAVTDITLQVGTTTTYTACPNIFSSSVDAQLLAHFQTSVPYRFPQTGCAGGPYPQVLCSQLAPIESITGQPNTGLSVAPSQLLAPPVSRIRH